MSDYEMDFDIEDSPKRQMLDDNSVSGSFQSIDIDQDIEQQLRADKPKKEAKKKESEQEIVKTVSDLPAKSSGKSTPLKIEDEDELDSSIHEEEEEEEKKLAKKPEPEKALPSEKEKS